MILEPANVALRQPPRLSGLLQLQTGQSRCGDVTISASAALHNPFHLLIACMSQMRNRQAGSFYTVQPPNVTAAKKKKKSFPAAQKMIPISLSTVYKNLFNFVYISYHAARVSMVTWATQNSHLPA